MEQRIKEVKRLGFRRILVPVRSLELQDKFGDLDFIGVKSVQDALDQLI